MDQLQDVPMPDKVSLGEFKSPSLATASQPLLPDLTSLSGFELFFSQLQQKPPHEIFIFSHVCYLLNIVIFSVLHRTQGFFFVHIMGHTR